MCGDRFGLVFEVMKWRFVNGSISANGLVLGGPYFLEAFGIAVETAALLVVTEMK